MGHKVLKPFPYAADGFNTRQTKVDEVLDDIKPEFVPGLIAEGYIADGGAAETLSKAAGEAALGADHGPLSDEAKIQAQADEARAGISDGKVGAPEAAAIIDANTAPAALAGSALAALKAEHRGAGSYSVMRGDEELVERLTKDEAKAFNELDAKAQADFVVDRTKA